MARIRRAAKNPFVVMPVIALLGLGGYWFTQRDAEPEQAAAAEQVVQASTGSMSETVTAEGTLAALQSEDLDFTASGTVTAVHAKAGDTVVAGQVLAELDSPELEQAVSDAEATLADAEAALADDEDADASDEQIEADESRVTTAEDSLTAAVEDLAGSHLLAPFDGTVTVVDIAVGDELGSGGSGGSDLTGSGSGSGQTAGDLGSGAGGFQDPTAASGDTSTEPDIRVVSTNRYEVELGLDDTEVADVAVGQEATVSLSTSSSGGGFFPGGGALPGGGAFPGGGVFPGGGAFPGGDGGQDDGGTDDGGTDDATGGTAVDPGAGATTDAPGATGAVIEVGEVADASSGVASYPVTVAFTDDSGDFNVGATVSVDIAYAERTDVVQVPTLAITTEDGMSTVTVRTDSGDEERTITTGLRSGTMTEVTSGLEAGESVVVSLPTFGGGGDGPAGGGTGPGNLPGFVTNADGGS